MVPTYPQNTDVTVKVDFPLIDGSPLTPSAIGFTVLDERGTIVRAREDTVPVDGVLTVEATIPAAANALVTGGAIRGLRTVRFTFDSDIGSYTVDARYIIEQHSKLILMFNSFQTYEEAIVARLDLPALDGWDVSSETDQIAALVTAHDRMCRATYRYKLSQDAVMYDSQECYWYVTNIRTRTPQDFSDFPDTFKTALRRAQVYEADSILSGDPVGDKRQQGVISETIGESKMFFSNTPPVRTPLCRAAMDVIGPHLYRGNRIGRA